jgi:hypothetical protein
VVKLSEKDITAIMDSIKQLMDFRELKDKFQKITVEEEVPAKTFLAKVISGGRITIPEELRTILGIKENSIIQLRYIQTVKTEPR